MSDNNEWEGEATAKEQHHHAQQTPLVVHWEWQVLWKDKSVETG